MRKFSKTSRQKEKFPVLTVPSVPTLTDPAFLLKSEFFISLLFVKVSEPLNSPSLGCARSIPNMNDKIQCDDQLEASFLTNINVITYIFFEFVGPVLRKNRIFKLAEII